MLSGCLLGAGAVAGAAGDPGGDGAHLLLVPDAPEAAAALERTSARVVASYGSFTLVEAAGDDVTRLRRAGADQRDDMREVRLAEREVDPRRLRSLAAKGSQRRGRARGLALVQFVGPVKPAWLERVRGTGARIVHYAAQNGFVVHGNGPALDALAGLVGTDPAVRAVTRMGAEDKAEGGVLARDRARVAIQTLSGEEGAAARGRIDRSGRALRDGESVVGLRTQFTELDGDSLRALAADPVVIAVEPYVEPELLDERAAQILAANLTGNLPSGPGYLAFLTGEGFGTSTFDFAIDVTDEGLDKGVLPAPAGSHPDFFADGNAAGTTRVVYQSDFTSDVDARDCGGHGTNVASIAAGFNNGTGSAGTTAVEDASGFNYGLGIAPRAKIGASKIFNCTGAFDLGSSFSALTSSAYAGGARISSNSWGAQGIDSYGDYNADSQTYDSLVRDAQPGAGTPGNQEIVEVFAAGNSGSDGYGTVSSPGTAKNVISVGASENVRPIGFTDGCGVPDSGASDVRDMIDFSSRGPTDDGRLKPDVVAPGTHVTGASPQHAGYAGGGTCNPQFPAGNTLYSLVSGTSQATPEVSGATAQVRDWYRREHGGDTVVPSPALTKAILVNTASDQAGGQDGKGSTVGSLPNTDQGWGRVNLGRVLDSTERQFSDQSDLLSASGQSALSGYEVQDTGAPVKVTLAWTDAPGPTTGNAFVNDLDLVVDAGGRTYKGNVFSGGASRTGGNADSRNNVESVYLPAGTSGRFAVRVMGTNIAGDGVPGVGDTTDQDFALVVSNANVQSAPVLSHDQTSGVSDSAGGDGDGVIETGEAFEFGEQVRNAGGAGATAVTGTLSTGAAGLNLSQPSSGYPDIAAGATGTNATPFEASLDLGATCGADLPVSLALTTAQGSYTVPFNLPTGEAAAPVVRTSTNVPKPIPDNDSAGVTSTLNVPASGRLKDLNVKIAGITHTWVGDLKLELTGPDGTTAVLAEHPGGPDNAGNNFTNTVFDDEAATSISTAGAPYSGSFRPQADQLARFDGKEQQGTWTLRVSDRFDGDTGSLTGWGIETTAAACSQTDTTAPLVTLSTPAGGPTTGDSTPTFSGTAGILVGDLETVTVKVFSGPAASGTPVQTRTAGRDPSTGAWSVDGSPALADGVYSARAEQSDSNNTGQSAPVTFTVSTSAAVPPPGEPNLAPFGPLIPLSKPLPPDTRLAGAALSASRPPRLAAALRKGVPVSVKCGEPCSGDLALALSSAVGRRVGLSRSVIAGRAKVKLSKAGARRVVVRFGRKPRAKLRRLRSLRLTLQAKLTDGSGNKRTVKRRLTLRR